MKLNTILLSKKNNDKKQKYRHKKLCFNCEKSKHMIRQYYEKQDKRLQAIIKPQKIEYLRAMKKFDEESEKNHKT